MNKSDCCIGSYFHCCDDQCTDGALEAKSGSVFSGTQEHPIHRSGYGEVPAPGAGTPIQTVGGLSNIDDKTLVATDERTFREAEANLEAIFFVFLHTLSSRMLSSRS